MSSPPIVLDDFVFCETVITVYYAPSLYFFIVSLGTAVRLSARTCHSDGKLLTRNVTYSVAVLATSIECSAQKLKLLRF